MCNGFELKVVSESFACSASSAVIKNETAKGAKNAEGMENSFVLKAHSRILCVPCGLCG